MDMSRYDVVPQALSDKILATAKLPSHEVEE
jgi:hypothetical protein